MFSYINNLAQLFPNEDSLVRVSAGSVLYQQGTPGDTLYVLKYGDVYINVDGKLSEVGSTGCLLGEECLLQNTSRKATVIAASDCGLVALDKTRLNQLINKTPGLLKHLQKIEHIRQNLRLGFMTP